MGCGFCFPRAKFCWSFLGWSGHHKLQSLFLLFFCWCMFFSPSTNGKVVHLRIWATKLKIKSHLVLHWWWLDHNILFVLCYKLVQYTPIKFRMFLMFPRFFKYIPRCLNHPHHSQSEVKPLCMQQTWTSQEVKEELWERNWWTPMNVQFDSLELPWGRGLSTTCDYFGNRLSWNDY